MQQNSVQQNRQCISTIHRTTCILSQITYTNITELQPWNVLRSTLCKLSQQSAITDHEHNCDRENA